MSNPQQVSIDLIRELAFGGISGSYAPVGTALNHAVRIVNIVNGTNAPLLISDDGVNDKLVVLAGQAREFPVNANRNGNLPNWVFRAGTQFSAKQVTAPSSGSVYIECLWGD